MIKLFFLNFLFLLIFLPSFAEEPSLLRGEIQNIDTNAVVINIGAEQGVKQGMLFEAYSEDKVYRLPLTDETLIKQGVVIGKLRVFDVASRFCRCEIIEPFDLKIGQLVIGRAAAYEGNQLPRFESVTWDPAEVSWGQPTQIWVKALDPENISLQLSGNATGGTLIFMDHQNLLWFPPNKPGKTQITLNLSDGIGEISALLDLNHKVSNNLNFSKNFTQVIGPNRFPFEKIDQLHVTHDGFIWILDCNQKKIVCLGRSLNVLLDLNLTGTEPQRFSVNNHRIAILDKRKERVLLYSREGKPLGRVSQKGSALNEWKKAFDVLLLRDNTLAVLDGGRQTVVLHDDQGRFVGCVGYPESRPPGFLKAQWLEAYENGFAVIDLDQYSRVIFDENFRFQETQPLEGFTLPLSGPEGPGPQRWPKELDRQTLIGVARQSGEGWIAVDNEGYRILRWNNQEESTAIFEWNLPSKSQLLIKGRKKSEVAWWLNKDLKKIFAIDPIGWKYPQTVPENLQSLTDFEPDSPYLWLDQKHRRLISGSLNFGQSGNGAGMMDGPEEALMWNDYFAVLDQERQKVLVFESNGVLKLEKEFLNCQSFCLDEENHLYILGRKGQAWRWKNTNEEPETLTCPNGLRLKSLLGGFLILRKDEIIIVDKNFKKTQALQINNIEDATQTYLGELWVLTRKGIFRFQKE